MRLNSAWILCLGLFCLNAWSADDLPTPSFNPDDLKQPVLSTTGKKRLRDNVRTLENNLKDLRENLVASEKNLTTIRAELKDISVLEKEHLDLRQKYMGYQQLAEQEMRKNEKAKRDLAKWEEKQKAQPNVSQEALKEKLESARMEQSERDRWKADADSKNARVRELISGVDKNLRDIRSRKHPLEQQLASWTARRDDYKKRITETEEKKAIWEKALIR
ncbi:hypothetical protein K2X33_00165 [bacterium]|nr:hypothetical protein [bacterium]